MSHGMDSTSFHNSLAASAARREELELLQRLFFSTPVFMISAEFSIQPLQRGAVSFIYVYCFADAFWLMD
jgi:hypothetical protein